MTKMEILMQLEEILGVYQQLKAESKPDGVIWNSFTKKADAIKYCINMLEQESNTSVSYK